MTTYSCCLIGCNVNTLALHHTTSHYITLHHTTSHYITLHSHYITLHHTTSHYFTLLHTTSHYITLHHTTSHYITLHHTTSHYITLHHTTSHYITLYHQYVTSVYHDTATVYRVSHNKLWYQTHWCITGVSLVYHQGLHCLAADYKMQSLIHPGTDRVISASLPCTPR